MGHGRKAFADTEEEMEDDDELSYTIILSGTVSKDIIFLVIIII